jgi:hypothetical protein
VCQCQSSLVHKVNELGVIEHNAHLLKEFFQFGSWVSMIKLDDIVCFRPLAKRNNETLQPARLADVGAFFRECSLGTSQDPKSTAIEMTNFRIGYVWSSIVPENCLYLILRPEA